jgi:hypothetical protein
MSGRRIPLPTISNCPEKNPSATSFSKVLHSLFLALIHVFFSIEPSQAFSTYGQMHCLKKLWTIYILASSGHE